MYGKSHDDIITVITVKIVIRLKDCLEQKWLRKAQQ